MLILPSALFVTLVLGFVPSTFQAAQPPRPAPTTQAEAAAQLRDNAVKRWEALGSKIVDLARKFPQEKAHFRFHPDTRTFLEEVWHETFDQQMLEARLNGTIKTIDQKKLFSGEGRPHDLQKAADELEAALKGARTFLTGENPSPGAIASLDFYIEHLGVAYGKLVAMYRANGLVPPVTQAAAARR